MKLANLTVEQFTFLVEGYHRPEAGRIFLATLMKDWNCVPNLLKKLKNQQKIYKFPNTNGTGL